MAATTPPGGSRGMDGRLDPEDLDRALVLDVVAHGDPDGTEDENGSGPWSVRGVLAVAAIALLLGGAAVVALTRQDPPPSLPQVSVSAGGATDVRAERDPVTRAVTGLSRLVVVSSSERPDVRVLVLGVRGPGLAEEFARVPTVTTGGARTGPVGAAVRCTDEEIVDAVLSSSAGDYRVVATRIASDGETDETEVALPGADEWLEAVRAVCVQSAADRGLRIAGADTAPVPGAAATEVVLTVRNDSVRQWGDARLVAGDDRAVAPTGDAVDLAPGASAELRAVVWARDCNDPVGDLEQGLVLEAAVGRQDGTGFAPLTRFRLDLGPDPLEQMESALLAQCVGTAPELRVVSATVRSGPDGDSAGAIDVVVDVTVPAASVGVGPVTDGSGQGRVTPAQDSWPVRDGTARAALRWELPSCLSLLTRGAVALPIRVADAAVERRYVAELRGEPLETALARVCGPTVAAIAR